MISLEYAKRTDRLMRATTSLTVAEFETLAGPLAALLTSMQMQKTVAGNPRQRQPGGGGTDCLASTQQKLFFILLYYKAYPT
jgi:hypothetical protein